MHATQSCSSSHVGPDRHTTCHRSLWLLPLYLPATYCTCFLLYLLTEINVLLVCVLVCPAVWEELRGLITQVPSKPCLPFHAMFIILMSICSLVYAYDIYCISLFCCFSLGFVSFPLIEVCFWWTWWWFVTLCYHWNWQYSFKKNVHFWPPGKEISFRGMMHYHTDIQIKEISQYLTVETWWMQIRFCRRHIIKYIEIV